MKIIVTTGNEGKLKEIKQIFEEYEVVSCKEAGFYLKVEEDAATFEGNAMKKASSIAECLEGICLGDDSGIMIDCLGGWPGVKTARWMDGTDREKNMGIIQKLKGIPKEKRTVHWVTAIAVVTADGKEYTSTYSVDGVVAAEPRGENGFGFDEIFELPCGKTLAELSNEEKNEIGARRKALEKIKKYLG